MSKEIPILFSTPMVQAILEGRKTQTRRIIKPQPDEESTPRYVPRSLQNDNDWGKWLWETPEGESILKFCPYGLPGNILWVRESWNMCTKDELAPGDPWMQRNDGLPEGEWAWVYRAGEINETHPNHPDWGKKRWKPSIHMPKAAARIWLKVTDVRVERLREISEEDAIAEGVEWHLPVPGDGPAYYKNYANPKGGTLYSAAMSFDSLWESINGAESWQQNPWVWVIEFKVLSTTGKP